jgi:hypothetical protein
MMIGDARCDSFHEQHRLPPGGGVEMNTSSNGVANRWTVTDSTGRTLGCLPLRYKHEIDGLVVSVLPPHQLSGRERRVEHDTFRRS